MHGRCLPKSCTWDATGGTFIRRGPVFLSIMSGKSKKEGNEKLALCNHRYLPMKSVDRERSVSERFYHWCDGEVSKHPESVERVSALIRSIR